MRITASKKKILSVDYRTSKITKISHDEFYIHTRFTPFLVLKKKKETESARALKEIKDNKMK